MSDDTYDVVSCEDVSYELHTQNLLRLAELTDDPDDRGALLGMARDRLTAAELEREVSASVYLFWSEMRDRFTWDLLPFDFLRDLFRSWSGRRFGWPVSMDRMGFVHDLLAGPVAQDGDWACEGLGGRLRDCEGSLAITTVPEPLVAEYGLGSPWNGTAKNGAHAPLTPEAFRGLVRRPAAGRED